MEAFILLLLFIVIILQVTNKNSYDKSLEELRRKITDLQYLIIHNKQQRRTEEDTKPYEPPVRETPPAAAEYKRPEVVKEVVRHPETITPENTERQEKVITGPPWVIERPVKTGAPPTSAHQPDEPALSFFDRHPDLEKFIGENLINKIGIAILVLAIGFFVKYAIDNNWIGPAGRVGIGILCGGILIAVAHGMRNSYKAFSSVLVGGGLAVLYFTITLAYHQFQLFDQTTSFIILIVITCFAVALSLLYDKQELAVIALLGGLSSPFMVSGDHANYHALFIYLIILNTGLLVIAYHKAWRVLNATAFGLTILVCGGVIFTLPADAYATGLLYTSILYLLFFGINVSNNIKENKKFIASDFTILLVNTALYFGAGLYLLTAMNHQDLRGLFSAALGFINLVLSYILFKNQKADTNIIYLLIGITLTFISLTAPIQLHGHNITLFWAAETVLLYWLYQRSGISLMKHTSLIVWIAMLVSLLLDWISVYGSTAEVITVIANKGFVTTLAASISSGLLAMLHSREEEPQEARLNSYKYSAVVLLFLSGLLEVNQQFLTRYPDTQLNSLYLMLYIPAFVYIFYMLWKKVAGIQIDARINIAILAGCITVCFAFTQLIFRVQYNILVYHTVSPAHFMAHWLGSIFIALLFYEVIVLARQTLAGADGFTWAISAGVVLFLSMELCLAVNQLFYTHAYTIENLETDYIR